LIRGAEKEFGNIKSDLVNEEVIDFAINIRGVLASISHKYSNDAIADLIPDITGVLNKLDASITVNNDLKSTITELSDENKLLQKLLESEKKQKKREF
jgi:hypothetical protein